MAAEDHRWRTAVSAARSATIHESPGLEHLDGERRAIDAGSLRGRALVRAFKPTRPVKCSAAVPNARPPDEECASTVSSAPEQDLDLARLAIAKGEVGHAAHHLPGVVALDPKRAHGGRRCRSPTSSSKPFSIAR
jgi:hypothetical protein